MRNPTEDLLMEVYIGARSGCEAICGLLPKITAEELLRETAAQTEMYSALSRRAQELLRDKRLGEAEFPLMSRLTVRGGMILETMGTEAQEELAELLCRGATAGAGRMYRAITECGAEGCDADALALAGRMMAYENEEAARLRAMRLT